MTIETLPATLPHGAETAPPTTTVEQNVAVRIEGLRKRFPVQRSWKQLLRHPFRREWHEVLRSVSLEVRRGEFFGLLGPNGAGKTTLFKTLSTLVTPDAGRIDVAGFDLVSEPHRVRRVLCPVIADERSLNWRLSARENLRIFAALHRLERRRVDEEIARVLEVVDLGDAHEKPVGQYSSGMKQRLLIARALLSRPEVLLLDEPTRSLDPVSARNFRQFLREEVVGRQGCTVLLATHSADEAFELCDRLAVLDRGRIVADGTATDLARKAGHSRYRLLVPAEHLASARQLLHVNGWSSFTAVLEAEDGWRGLEGELTGGPAEAGLITRTLVENGIPVGEIGRVQPTLADIIERLVRRGAAA